MRSSLPCTGLRRIKEGRANGAEHEQGGARADESVLDRVAAFLPMMQQSNAELLRRAAADPRSVIVDDPEGSAEEDDEDEEGDEDDEDSSGDDEHDDDGGDEDDDEDENMEESGAEAKTARIAGQQRPRRIVEMVRPCSFRQPRKLSGRTLTRQDVNLGVYGMREGAQPSGDMGPEVMLDEERIRRHMERYGGPAAGRDGVDDGSGGSGASGGLVRDGDVLRE